MALVGKTFTGRTIQSLKKHKLLLALGGYDGYLSFVTFTHGKVGISFKIHRLKKPVLIKKTIQLKLKFGRLKILFTFHCTGLHV